MMLSIDEEDLLFVDPLCYYEGLLSTSLYLVISVYIKVFFCLYSLYNFNANRWVTSIRVSSLFLKLDACSMYFVLLKNILNDFFT